MAGKTMPERRMAILDIHSALYLRTKGSKYCGGDIGDLYQLVDKASAAGFSFIQMNPIQDTSKSPSPYMGLSIFSFNPVDLSIERLTEAIDPKLIDQQIYQRAISKKLDHVTYRNLYQFKVQALRQIFDRKCRVEPIDARKYDRNVLAYAVFKALKHRLKSHWYNWPQRYRSGDIASIVKDNPSLHREIQFYLFVQETLRAQWLELKEYAKKRNISLILDKPIYPVHDSAEVWANQDLFYLKPDGSLRYGSGCNNPRDPFGAQYWGHAVYKFKECPKEVINYFLQSISFISQLSDTVRLDHTLALIWKYYLVNPKTRVGRHHPALKHKLFNALDKTFPSVDFIAEDVGYVSNRYVDAPLSEHHIPGMRCIQWFWVPKYSKVAEYPENCLAMTSNHDMESLPSWWRQLRADRKIIYSRQLNQDQAEDFESQVWQLVRLIFESGARLASITLRDLAFDLRRYNKPGGKYIYNWTTRERLVLDSIDFLKIAEIIKASHRS